jgi:hypothetical protein
MNFNPLSNIHCYEDGNGDENNLLPFYIKRDNANVVIFGQKQIFFLVLSFNCLVIIIMASYNFFANQSMLLNNK